MKKKNISILLNFILILLLAIGLNADEPKNISQLLELSDENLVKNTSEAMKYAQQALKISQEEDNTEDRIKAILKVGEILIEEEEYIKAYENINQALSLSKENDLKKGILNAIILTASLQQHLKNYSKSNQLYLEALKLSIEIEDDFSRATCLSGLGLNNMKLKHFDLSYQFLEEALRYYEITGNIKKRLQSLNHFVKLNIDMENYDTAYDLCLKSIELCNEIDQFLILSLNYNDLAWIYHKQGDQQNAILYNQKAYDTRMKIKNIILASSSLVNIAGFYQDYGNYDKAQTYYFRALELVESSSSNRKNSVKLRVYDGLATIYTLKENYKNAVRYYHLYSELFNTQEKERSYKEINEKETSFEIRFRDYQNETATKLLQLKINRQRSLIYFMLIIFVLLFIMIVVIYLLFLQRKKQNLILNNEIKIRRKTEFQLMKYKDDLKLINKIMRHDVTNDLVVIKSALNLYEQDQDKKWLQNIQERVDKSIKLIQSLKKKEQFNAEYSDLKPIELKKVIDEVVTHFPDLSIKVTNNCVVMADEKIASVFENLINNASKHGLADKVEITLESSEVECNIKISNNGKAIPQADVDKIFEEGFANGKTGNTGIGLSIVKSYIEQIGGWVGLSSNQDGMVEFSIILSKALK